MSDDHRNLTEIRRRVNACPSSAGRNPGVEQSHSDGSDGLPAYVTADRPLANRDIVAWHVFGLHHQPRPEDFPVQPVITCGFKLMPSGFFDANPCLDLPAAANQASCRARAAE